MPETRYVRTYDQQGNLLSSEPYTVSDAQLADERADTMMAELKQSFRDGAYPVSSKPASGEKRVTSIQVNAGGKTDVKYDNTPEP